jgi:hypothetical protein
MHFICSELIDRPKVIPIELVKKYRQCGLVDPSADSEVLVSIPGATTILLRSSGSGTGLIHPLEDN